MRGEFTFRDFYRALYHYDPFPWQERLAALVCESGWPQSLDLPTASGKTSTIDVAVYAMALTGRGPRRVFFVVDRRIVVDQAFDHMQELACKLRDPTSPILSEVASRLKAMSGDDEALAVYQMRGGIYRDDSWVRSPLQPMLIASTVDQVGSRLLFRGYGVWDKTASIHAALASNDSLILLDEAHCSKAFAQTLDRIAKYRSDAVESLQTPFTFVEMTATPTRENSAGFALLEEDRKHPELRKRLYAPKTARLIVSKARLKDFDKLAEDLVEQSVLLSKQPGLRRIAVIVNRVRTARLIYAKLLRGGHKAHLLIGRMRPLDRMDLHPEIEQMLSRNARSVHDPVFVVATQCLEVGADLDFDALITECASIDALLQRFGRLDRTGKLFASGVEGQGRIVIAGPMSDDKYRDPIYQEALSKTWRWLTTAGNEHNFGIYADGPETVYKRLKALGKEADGLRRESPNAPVLLPSHLDAFAQTSPKPALNPDPRLFLHGQTESSPDVQVVWRADLDPNNWKQWAEIVALCAPLSLEAMPVPIGDFRKWLTNVPADSTASDVEGASSEEEDDRKTSKGKRCEVLLWRGDESLLVDDPRRIQPGDTFVLPEAEGGWDELGHIPEHNDKDVAEKAQLVLRRRWTLRLFPALVERWPDKPERVELLALARDSSAEKKRISESLRTYTDELDKDHWLRTYLNELLSRKLVLEEYPSAAGEHKGWVLTARYAEADSGQDESSAAEETLLDNHLADVAQAVRRISSTLIDDEALRHRLVKAAELHDCGKADLRFQALLRGGDPMAAQFAPKLLAKGTQSRPSPAVRQLQWQRSGLPKDFRHELVSLSMIRNCSEIANDELILHLVASHHGRCRPFAPVVGSESAVEWNSWRLSDEEAKNLAAHRLDSGVADRFWKLTRTYGWWGLAYLETLVRLADWQASQKEVS